MDEVKEMTTKTKSCHQIARGQIWRESDPRHIEPRHVRVERVEGNTIITRTVQAATGPHGGWEAKPKTTERECKRSRFNGLKGGYIWVEG